MAKLVPGEPATVLLHLSNSGMTPAIDAAIVGDAVGRASLSEIEFGGKPTGGRLSNMVIGPGGTVTVFLDTNERVQQAHLKAIYGGMSRLFAFGTIYYQDIFGQPHTTTFCFSVGAEELARWPNDPKVLAMVACARQNGAK